RRRRRILCLTLGFSLGLTCSTILPQPKFKQSRFVYPFSQ
ncbi:unnamed protein product, partial [Arabidopsis halleri]